MRIIDADALHEEISAWPESVMFKDWVQSAIANTPTIASQSYGPLTPDELMEMPLGDWVWIQALNIAQEANIIDGYYRKMDGYRTEDAFYFGYPEYEEIGHTAWAEYADYGKTWFAYRRRPEES